MRLETLLPLGKVDPGLRALVTDIEFSIAVRDERDRAQLAELAQQIQTSDDSRARATIAGR